MPNVSPVKEKVVKEISLAIAAFRTGKGLSREGFARELGVSLNTVVKWERMERSPSLAQLKIFAQISSGAERKTFQEAARIKAAGMLRSQSRKKHATQRMELGEEYPPIDLHTTEDWIKGTKDRLHMQAQVPVFADAASAGGGRIIKEGDIESFIAVPARYCPKGPGHYIGLYVKGDSMEPVLRDGFIVVVDTGRTNPMKLKGRMVVARHPEEGVMVKVLARESREKHLIFRSLNRVYEDIIVERAERRLIIGDVVFWWGMQTPEGGQ